FFVRNILGPIQVLAQRGNPLLSVHQMVDTLSRDWINFAGYDKDLRKWQPQTHGFEEAIFDRGCPHSPPLERRFQNEPTLLNISNKFTDLFGSIDRGDLLGALPRVRLHWSTAICW